MEWYQKPLLGVCQEFSSDLKRGITQKEATERLTKYGKNILPRGKKTAWYQFLGRQFKSPLIYILLFAAALTTWIAILPEHVSLVDGGGEGGENKWVDTIIILVVVIINVSVGFWQEFRSNNILKALQAVVKTTAFVVREGEMHEINAESLVPGDIIILKTGNKVPADARVIDAHKLETNESILTGESSAVSKESIDMTGTKDAALGDRKNMVHMGTLVSRGEGMALVVATGAKSAFGQIALLTQQAEDEPTPLQLRIGKLGKRLAIIMGCASLLIFVAGITEGHTLVDMMTTAVAVAVAAIPEGLPTGISIILAVSAQKILHRKGVVKKLVAAETLGSASVICADKTGTLTEGKMVLEKLVVESDPARAERALALANEGIIEVIAGKQVVRGETTDQTKLQYFVDKGGNVKKTQEEYPRISLLSFDPANKYVASFHGVPRGGSYVLCVNGAPEIVLSLCTTQVGKNGHISLTDDDKKRLHKEYEELAAQSYRVLGIAERSFDRDTLPDGNTIDLEERDTRAKLISEMTFLGYAAIRDPIRDDVYESVKQAREAGIKVVMMTGDHILTARAIAAELGFKTDEKAIMEGKVIEGKSDEELTTIIAQAEVFARVNPEHKMRIIEILQKKGEVVAMTGDGVNDAPALRAADIGVAVGSGTDIAKEASDLVLLDDSFTSIVEAIRQGRIAFDNIRKVTVFLLAGSFTEIVIIMAPLLLGLEYLPLTAVLILWTNMVEDSLPNIALSFEPGEKDVMRRPPISKKEPVLDRESNIIVYAVGLITDFFLLGIFLYFYFADTVSVEHVRTLIFACLGLDFAVYVYSIKNLRKPIFSYSLVDNKLLVGATLIGLGLMLSAIYVPWLRDVLGTAPLGASDWILVGSVVFIKVIGIEVVKWWFIHRNSKRNTESTLAAGVRA